MNLPGSSFRRPGDENKIIFGKSDLSTANKSTKKDLRNYKGAQGCPEVVAANLLRGVGGTTADLNPRMAGQWGEPERTSQPDDPGAVGGFHRFFLV